MAPSERHGSRNRTAEGRKGLGGVGAGSMVIITELVAGQATAGAAASGGRSGNAGIGAAAPGGRRDAQDAAGLVDGGDGKSSGLADPQAAAVNQAETAAVSRIANRGENAAHFGMGKRLRQPPLLGKPNLFLNSAQSLPSVSR